MISRHLAEKMGGSLPCFKGGETEAEEAGGASLNSPPGPWENQGYKLAPRSPAWWAALETALQ